MRVAALYDIHGNLPALEAVLQDIRQAEVDYVAVGGDVIPGPMPRETLTCLLDLNIPVQFIQGNGDREALAQMAGTDTLDFSHFEDRHHLASSLKGDLCPELADVKFAL